MKKHILFLAMAAFFSISAFAQGPQRMTPEERTKATMEKLAPLALTEDQAKSTNAIFLETYTTQQKYMEEMRASGTMDRDAMKAKRDELAAARDAKLKAVFTADQYKKWIDEVEPSLRPQRKQN